MKKIIDNNKKNLIFYFSTPDVLLYLLETAKIKDAIIIVPAAKKNELKFIKNQKIKVLSYDTTKFGADSFNDSEWQYLREEEFDKTYIVSKIRNPNKIDFYQNVIDVINELNINKKYIVFQDRFISELNGLYVKKNNLINKLFNLPVIQQIITLFFLPWYYLKNFKKLYLNNDETVIGYGEYYHLTFFKNDCYYTKKTGIYKYCGLSGGGFVTSIYLSFIMYLLTRLTNQILYRILPIIGLITGYLFISNFNYNFLYPIIIFILSPFFINHFFNLDAHPTIYGFALAIFIFYALFSANSWIVSSILFILMGYIYLPFLISFGIYFFLIMIYSGYDTFFITLYCIPLIIPIIFYLVPIAYYSWKEKIGINYYFKKCGMPKNFSMLDSVYNKRYEELYLFIYYIIFYLIVVFKYNYCWFDMMILYPIIFGLYPLLFRVRGRYHKTLELFCIFAMLIVLTKIHSFILLGILTLYVFQRTNEFYKIKAGFNVQIDPLYAKNYYYFVDKFKKIPSNSRISFEETCRKNESGLQKYNYLIEYLLKERGFEILNGSSIVYNTELINQELSNISVDGCNEKIYKTVKKYSIDYLIVYSHQLEKRLIISGYKKIFDDKIRITGQEIYFSLLSTDVKSGKRIYNIYPGLNVYNKLKKVNFTTELKDIKFSFITLYSDLFKDMIELIKNNFQLI